MMRIVNEEKISEAFNLLCGLGDFFDSFGDEESLKTVEEIETLLRSGIEETNS